MKRDLFKRAYFGIEKQIKNDSELFTSIVSISLLGSAADGENVADWSDLDVLVILKTDTLGNISIGNLNRLQKIVNRASTKYDFPISILCHSLDDFHKYISFEYLKHYSFGLCTYPSSDYLERTINDILSKRDLSDKIRKAYCAYHTRHIRFNLLRKYVSADLSQHKTMLGFTKLLIDKMIKATDLSLNYINVWPKGKDDIYEKANRALGIDCSVLQKGLLLRKNWNQAPQADLATFTLEGLGYIETVSNIILKDYTHPTPEEYMSQ
jgi:predicted nucleotidyltransferase